VQQQLNN